MLSKSSGTYRQSREINHCSCMESAQPGLESRSTHGSLKPQSAQQQLKWQASDPGNLVPHCVLQLQQGAAACCHKSLGPLAYIHYQPNGVLMAGWLDPLMAQAISWPHRIVLLKAAFGLPSIRPARELVSTSCGCLHDQRFDAYIAGCHFTAEESGHLFLHESHRRDASSWLDLAM